LHLDGSAADYSHRLKGIPLPIKIKCGRCQKNLPQAKYSTKQLTDARWQIKNSAKIYKAINCQACTGQQKVEVECTMCGKTKGLEEFAKSQRAKPDTAKCFKCIEAQLADEAVDEDRYENLENAFLPADHSNGQYPEYFSSATTDTSSNYVSSRMTYMRHRQVPLHGGFCTDFQRATMNGRPSMVEIGALNTKTW
jgi:DNA repair protein RAD7